MNDILNGLIFIVVIFIASIIVGMALERIESIKKFFIICFALSFAILVSGILVGVIVLLFTLLFTLDITLGIEGFYRGFIAGLILFSLMGFTSEKIEEQIKEMYDDNNFNF